MQIRSIRTRFERIECKSSVNDLVSWSEYESSVESNFLWLSLSPMVAVNGGVHSSILFTVYTDELLIQLKLLGVVGTESITFWDQCATQMIWLFLLLLKLLSDWCYVSVNRLLTRMVWGLVHLKLDLFVLGDNHRLIVSPDSHSAAPYFLS